ncbi:hypothetical protein IHE48_28915 [Frankia sp. CH37]|nr:hypothetical protein [Parafrankia sp. CH37]
MPAARVLLPGAAIVTVTALIGATGQGTAPVRLDLVDDGTWLTDSATGTLIHLSGPAGRANAAVTVPGTAGRDLTVTSTAHKIVAVDPSAGQAFLVDPARLATVGSAALRPGVAITSASGITYAVEAGAGRVQPLSADDLSPIGTALDLPSPLGAAAQSDDGTLWVPLRSTGTVVAVRDGVAAPVAGPVAPPGNAIDVVLAGGRPVVVDSTARSLRMLGGPGAPGESGAGARTVLPLSETPAPAGPELLVAPRTERGVVGLLDPVARRLYLADVDHGTVAVTDLPSRDQGQGQPGVPVVQAGHAYVPESALGVVLDYDLAHGTFGAPVAVAAADGHARITVTVDDGQVWINDTAGPNAVLINDRGRTPISKQPPDLPGLPTSSAQPLPAAPPLPRPQQPRPDGAAHGQGAARPTPAATTTRTPTAATSGPGTGTGTGPGTRTDTEAEHEQTTPEPTRTPTTPPPRTPSPPPVTTHPVTTPPPSPTTGPSASPDGLPIE